MQLECTCPEIPPAGLGCPCGCACGTLLLGSRGWGSGPAGWGAGARWSLQATCSAKPFLKLWPGLSVGLGVWELPKCWGSSSAGLEGGRCWLGTLPSCQLGLPHGLPTAGAGHLPAYQGHFRQFGASAPIQHLGVTQGRGLGLQGQELGGWQWLCCYLAVGRGPDPQLNVVFYADPRCRPPWGPSSCVRVVWGRMWGQGQRWGDGDSRVLPPRAAQDRSTLSLQKQKSCGETQAASRLARNGTQEPRGGEGKRHGREAAAGGTPLVPPPFPPPKLQPEQALAPQLPLTRASLVTSWCLEQEPDTGLRPAPAVIVPTQHRQHRSSQRLPAAPSTPKAAAAAAGGGSARPPPCAREGSPSARWGGGGW